jgi:hypothetical protein
MSADEVRHIHTFSRHIPVATVSSRLVAPQVGFGEDDPKIFGFEGQGSTGPPTSPALLPGTTQHFSFDAADFKDPFCNAHFDYIIAIEVLTFHSL